MSDDDWYAKQGIHFQYRNAEVNNDNQSTESLSSNPESKSQYPTSTKPKAVMASKMYIFGEKTLAGMTVIIITLSIQLFFLLMSTIDFSESNEEVTLSNFEDAAKDIETKLQIQIIFGIVIIVAQLIGLKMIYNDVRDLSHSLNEDVSVRNTNLVALTEHINRK